MIDFEENMNLVPFTIHRYFPYLAQDEDAVQEGYASLWKACIGYSVSRGSFSTYAVRAISNAMKTYLRDASTGIPHYTCSAYDTSAARNRSSVDARYSQIEASMAVAGFRKTLNDSDAELLDMHLAGTTLREIAEMHGVTHQWVSKRLIRIRAKLAAYIDKDWCV